VTLAGVTVVVQTSTAFNRALIVTMAFAKATGAVSVIGAANDGALLCSSPYLLKQVELAENPSTLQVP
jgi:hypothetical protein